VEPLARRNRQVRSVPKLSSYLSIYRRTHAATLSTTLGTTLSTLNECSMERLAFSRLHALVRSTSQPVSPHAGYWIGLLEPLAHHGVRPCAGVAAAHGMGRCLPACLRATRGKGFH